MTLTAQVRLVARREFTQTVHTRSFVTGTAFSMLFVAAIVAAISLLPALFGDDDPTPVGALPAAEPIAVNLPLLLGPDSVEILTFTDEADARQALLDDVIHVLLLGGTRVAVSEGLDPVLAGQLGSAVGTVQLAEQLDVSPEQILAATAVTLDVEILDPVDPELAQRRGMTLFGVMLVLGQVMGGAFMVAYGIAEEKSSRVVEVVISKVTPRTLLTGKLVGLGLANLVQLAAMVVAGLVAVTISPDLSIPAGLVGASGMVLIWFLLAYAIFASLFSIAGAITARQEEMQQKVLPAMYLLFLVFGAAFLAYNRPDSLLTSIALYLPLTAPAVAPLLDAVTGLAAWQLLLAMASTLAGAAAAIWIAGAVYSGGALHLRGTTTVRQAVGNRQR
jgi:ABC-2 type transport system permease protein